jgi:hypothetical protein
MQDLWATLREYFTRLRNRPIPAVARHEGLLLNDEFAPITSEIGFLKADLQTVVAQFLQWQQAIPQNARSRWSQRSISSDLKETVRALLPLTTFPLRHLFVPTHENWTAYFDNGWRGTDAFSTIGVLAKQIACMGVISTAIPHTFRKVDANTYRGRMGALRFSVYGPDDTEWLNQIRNVHLLRDEDEIDFNVTGTPFPFEELDKYHRQPTVDRFTLDMLRRYLHELELRPFDEAFFLSQSCSILIERRDSSLPKVAKYSLEQARAAF